MPDSRSVARQRREGGHGVGSRRFGGLDPGREVGHPEGIGGLLGQLEASLLKHRLGRGHEFRAEGMLHHKQGNLVVDLAGLELDLQLVQVGRGKPPGAAAAVCAQNCEAR